MAMTLAEAVRLATLESKLDMLAAYAGADVGGLVARVAELESRLQALEQRPRPGRKPKVQQ